MNERPKISRNDAFDYSLFDNKGQTIAALVTTTALLLVASAILPLFVVILVGFWVFIAALYAWRCYKARQWYRYHDAHSNLVEEDGGDVF